MKINSSTDPGNHTVRVIAISLIGILLVIMLTGCRSDSGTTVGSGTDVTGVYALVSVDGKTLPCILKHAGTSMTIESGTFTITDDGQCISSINLNLGSTKNLTKETRARYTQSGNELTMKWERAGTTKGRADGRNFTMNNEGMIFSYQK